MAMVKTKKEISLFKKAASISNSCIPLIEKSLREGVTERELARRIKKKIKSQGGESSFGTLVGSGERSAMVHTVPRATDRKISGIGYVDFGASYKGYKIDVTVPFIKGNVNSRERKIVKTVLEAYNIALKTWKIGMPCWKLHEKIDGYLSKRGLRMGHALGHGLGKKIHEDPKIMAPTKKSLAKATRMAKAGNRKMIKKLRKWERIKKVKFEPGMVFTIEPGAYVKGLGGSRIENSFMASWGKLKSLTKAKLIQV